MHVDASFFLSQSYKLGLTLSLRTLHRPDFKPDFSPDNTSLLWVTNVLPSLGDVGSYGGASLHDCTLGPGEILWLGHEWWHATLNIGDTVFLSTFI